MADPAGIGGGYELRELDAGPAAPQPQELERLPFTNDFGRKIRSSISKMV
jgi:hypothetical protein